jgi:hypothetical protein
MAVRLMALVVLVATAAACGTTPRTFTAREECARAGGVWMAAGCEHAAGGGGGGM